MSRKDNLCEQDRSRKYVDLLEQHYFQSEYRWLNPNRNDMTTASGNCSTKHNVRSPHESSANFSADCEPIHNVIAQTQSSEFVEHIVTSKFD